MKQPLYYRSNMVENLYCYFSENLFKKNSDPLRRRIVVVPSHAIEEWLKKQLLQEKGICMGVEFFFLNKALQESQKTANKNDETDTLTIHIENLIFNLKKESSPLLNDIIDDNSAPETISALSYQLAFLFLKYKLYARNMITQWESADAKNLQQFLWLNLKKNNVIGELPQKESFSENIDLHIFGLNHMPLYFQTLLQQLSDQINIYQYIFSPCCYYWGDSKNKREISSQYRRLEKQNVPIQELYELEEFLLDNNPILANLGKVGRYQHNIIEDLGAHIENNYFSYRLTNSPDTQQLKITPKLLNHLQDDILTMRSPISSCQIDIENDDNSIIIAYAPSRLREIETLYNNLIATLEKNHNINVDNIIVMAPDIELYTPYIKAVFGSYNSVLPYSYSDSGLNHQPPFIELFLQALQLINSRWEAEDIYTFIMQPDIYNQVELSLDDIYEFKKQLQKNIIFWGKDAEHRKKILPEIFANSEIGTWEYSITELLKNIASDDDESALNFSQINQIGKIIKLVRELYDDLDVFNDNNRATTSFWAKQTLKILIKYFCINEENKSSYNQIQKTLQNFIDNSFSDIEIYPETFLLLIKNKLQSCTPKFSIGGGISFCSMMPMRAIPAQIIAVIGLNDKDYPRHETPQALNMMINRDDVDYYPSRIDYDRYIFLEALLSARENFYCSYNSELPSLIIQEMLDYLKEGFNVNIENILQKHASAGYSNIYFNENGRYKNFIVKNQKITQLQQNQNHNNKNINCKITTQLEKINIEDLVTATKNPAKLYFNKILGIYLNNQESNTYEFELSALNKYLIHSESVIKPAQGLLEKYAQKGLLPLGFFSEVAKKQLMDEIEERKLSICDEIFSIDLIFDENIEVAQKINDQQWVLPALIVGNDKIIGTLKNISNSGLIIYGTKSFNDIAKQWSTYLIMIQAIKEHNLPIKPQLIFIKDNKTWSCIPENVLDNITSLIQYYKACLEQCLPLKSEFLQNIIKNDFKAFSKQYIGTNFDLKNSFDPYRLWLQKYNQLPDAENVFTECKEVVTEAYKPLQTQFNKKK